ncbi:MAG: Ppx/GppA phosphatase family protein [Pseudomonadota bacterium]|nr:Ppx/GppA phosphatase family protein [Pseudomonadota bacterium]
MKTQYYAGVDLGSNSFHLVLARRVNQQLQIVDRMREMVRLGAGLRDDGRIDKETQTRALAAAVRFGDRLRGLPSDHVRVVGTYTLRRARRADKFLDRVADAIGHPVEIISGQEEARLIYRGVGFTRGVAKSRRLVFDIGGGSTELILGEGPHPLAMESLFMGCVSYSHRFFPNGRITRKRWRQAEIAARLELQPVESQFRGLGWQEAVGTSGSVRAMSNVLTEQGAEDGVISPAGLADLKQQLLDIGHIDRLSFPTLTSDRAAVFVGGVVILCAAFEGLGIERLIPCDGALREGLLDEMVGPEVREDVRNQTVESLLTLYHADRLQAQQVGDTAIYFFDQVAAQWGIDDHELRELLAYSAQLHEIGLAVSHSGYHKHGHYLLSHGDLAGFSWENQGLIAALVRLHRRKLVLQGTADQVVLEYSNAVLPLIVLLRLAVLMHRNRVHEAHPDVTLTAGDKKLHLQFPPRWLSERPLMEADLIQEARYLRGSGYKLTFGSEGETPFSL